MFKCKSNLNHLINLLDIGSVVLYPPELGFDKTDHRVFPHKIGVFFIWSVVGVFHLVSGRYLSLVGGRWSEACGRLCVWSVVGGFYGRCDRWSVSVSVGGWCFMFLMVGSFIDNGRWSVLSSVWSVVGGLWAMVLYYAHANPST